MPRGPSLSPVIPLPFVLLLGLALAYSYRFVADQVTGNGITGALAVNAALACLVLFLRRRGLFAPYLLREGTWGKHLSPRWLYAPAALVCVGSLLLVAFSRQFGTPSREQPLPELLALTITLVPIMEEISFRAGLTPLLQRLAGPRWGSYWSALLFAWVHSVPTLSGLWALNVAVPLGPLLLGLIAEVLYRMHGRLGPAIAFHMACNATVAIFAWGDQRFFTWFNPLYY